MLRRNEELNWSISSYGLIIESLYGNKRESFFYDSGFRTLKV